MMCYNFGNQKVIFLQGMGDGIGHEKKPRKIRESLPRLPQEKETQMLYFKWVMGHTLEYIVINFLIDLCFRVFPSVSERFRAFPSFSNTCFRVFPSVSERFRGFRVLDLAVYPSNLASQQYVCKQASKASKKVIQLTCKQGFSHFSDVSWVRRANCPTFYYFSACWDFGVLGITRIRQI
jgi:hypothetical protein